MYIIVYICPECGEIIDTSCGEPFVINTLDPQCSYGCSYDEQPLHRRPVILRVNKITVEMESETRYEIGKLPL